MDYYDIRDESGEYVLMPVRAFIVLDRLGASPSSKRVCFVLMPVRAFIVLDPFNRAVIVPLNNRLNAREGIYCFG